MKLKLAVLKSKVVKLPAIDPCISRKWGKEKMKHLLEQMDAYRANAEDYQRSLAPRADTDEWWEVVGNKLPLESDKTPAIITIFARMLLADVPHAADPERAFSVMEPAHTQQAGYCALIPAECTTRQRVSILSKSLRTCSNISIARLTCC